MIDSEEMKAFTEMLYDKVCAYMTKIKWLNRKIRHLKAENYNLRIELKELKENK
jgi:hypothetical protein